MKRFVRTASVAAVLIATAACSESSPTGPDESVNPPAGVVVSNVLQSGATAYLSAVAGTFPEAVSVSVSNKTKPRPVRTESTIDGGFDPIGIEAQTGDELSVVVSLAAGGTKEFAVEVPQRRSPSVVRTSPVKTPDAVGNNIVVVFSEPVELSSLTSTSITLTRGGTAVEGSVSLSVDRLTIEFIPDSALHPQAPYQLTVDAGIRDLDGDMLGQTPVVIFTISRPASAGAIEVSVVTSGPDQDADGYLLSAAAPRSHQIGRLAGNGVTMLTGTEPGDVSLTLYGLAPNCDMTGPNPRTLRVDPGVTAKISYVVTCVVAGALRVTTVTTGADPDVFGYRMIERDRGRLSSDISHSFTSGLDLGLPPNGTVRASGLAAGSYVVTISDIAPNCKPVVSNVQTITIVAGAESSLRFEVTCVEAIQIAFVRDEGPEDSDWENPDIYLVKSNGDRTIRLTSEQGADIDPAWSPDGSKIAFASDRAGNREIYVMNADGSDPVRITNHVSADYLPAYSPDGKQIAFVSKRSGNADIYLMNIDGTDVVRLTNNTADDSEPAWSPDGSKIAFARAGHIYTMSRDGSGETRLTSIGFNEQPAWSPDGSTLAMLSKGRDTYPAIYLMNADGSQVRRVLGVGYFPSSPDWSPDGKLIAFDDWDCWDYGPCPTGIIIGTADGLYSIGIDDAAQPAWRPRSSN